MNRPFIILVLAGAAIVGSCGAGGVRPRYQPFAGSVSDTIPAPPDDVIRALELLVRAESLPLRQSSAREGYLETGWFNAETGRWGGGASLNTKEVARIRFWTDEVREGTSIVVGEAATRRIVDPSVADRETETRVPDGHAADSILRRVLDSLRARTGR